MALENKLHEYVERFNEKDDECVIGYVPNTGAEEWLSENVPLIDIPDSGIEEIYYFRWWTYRKHIKETPEGFIISEFLPDVGWAQKYNSINCAAGHHIYEGRWLKNSRYMEDYIRFWFKGSGSQRQYSVWLCDAVYNYCRLKGDFALAFELLDDMVKNYYGWEETNLTPMGLFWSFDGYDGGEISISGHGYRPTLNSYMWADATAISKIAAMRGDTAIADEFASKAEKLKDLMQKYIWDGDFFKVVPIETIEDARKVDENSVPERTPDNDVRELFGFIPWYFNLPDPGHESAWKYFRDEKHFKAPYGYTSADISHPRFMFEHPHECLWNGPVWPFNESQAIKGCANVIRNYGSEVVDKKDLYDAISTYAMAQHLTREDGTVVPWIDEDMHPFTGDWTARTILFSWGNVIYERGKDYNHSTFCDNILSDLLGISTDASGNISVSPLVPDDWSWFKVENLEVGGKTVTITFDKDGTHYGEGKGLIISEN